MREILFRGMDSDGYWHYGYPCHMPRGGLGIQHETGLMVGVTSSTIGQFTGMTDKNGVKIFEGDKISLSCGCCYYVIKWDAESLRWFPEDDGLSPRHGIYINMWESEIEVIGNIHEKEK